MTEPSFEPSVRRIFQPIRGRRIRKLLWKRLHLPRGIVHPALSAAKAAANPAQIRVRRQLAQELPATTQAIGDMGEKGYLLLDPGAIPGSEAVVARCAEIYRELRKTAAVDDHLFNPRKRFLLAMLSGPDFLEHPELIRFMVSRPILDTVTAYMGSVPILAGAALWWTPVNETAHRSQLYHFDGEDEKQAKLLFNIFDTQAENGPFTLISADASEPLRGARSFRRRITDQEVDARCGLGHAMQLVGPAGAGAFVDTSRCLHYGSRHASRDRVVLVIQFLRFNCPTESTFDFRVPPDLPGLEPDPLQKLALGLE
jgi:hypothetical protein